MTAGGPTSSSYSGGLKDGVRSMWMGLCAAGGPCMCASCGLARPGDCIVGVPGFSPSPVRAELSALSVGRNDVGEFRCLAAPGQPHS